MEEIRKVLETLFNNKMPALIVGGWVRDKILGIESKDIDIEVYETSVENLKKVIDPFGRIDEVGKAFGIIKLTMAGKTYDFSVPRWENRIGVGHKDFEIIFDQNITPYDAALRRDFTMNSMAYNLLEDDIIDYFGGKKDIENQIIRHTSKKFTEDPLRILRALQFQARFGFTIDINTMQMMNKMAKEYHTIPKERIAEEWMKWGEKGRYWYMVFDTLRGIFEDIDVPLEYQNLLKLKNTPQDPEWHPEGNVEIHTKHCLRAAYDICEREKIYGEDRIVFVFSVLFHDICKPETTETIEGHITSRGHEHMGAEQVIEIILPLLGIKTSIKERVSNLVKKHMIHIGFDSLSPSSQKRFLRRLSIKLQPATIRELVYVMEADHSGRPPLPAGMPKDAQMMLDVSKELTIHEKPMQGLVMGRDLINVFKLTPGPYFREILQECQTAQVIGELETLDDGLEWIAKNDILVKYVV